MAYFQIIFKSLNIVESVVGR